MTEREYQYFMMISEKCTDKGKVTKGKPDNNNEYPHFDSPSKTTNFNRRKITIKTDTKTYGGGIGVEVIDGVYVGATQSTLETRWVAHEGFNPISLVKFFEITGYNKEANRYRNLYLHLSKNSGFNTSRVPFIFILQSKCLYYFVFSIKYLIENRIVI